MNKNSYNKVILIAKKVKNQSDRYKKQLSDCKNKLDRKRYIIF